MLRKSRLNRQLSNYLLAFLVLLDWCNCPCFSKGIDNAQTSDRSRSHPANPTVNSAWDRVDQLRELNNEVEADKLEEKLRVALCVDKRSLAEHADSTLRDGGYLSRQTRPYEPKSARLAAKICLALTYPNTVNPNAYKYFTPVRRPDPKVTETIQELDEIYRGLATDDQRVLANRAMLVALYHDRTADDACAALLNTVLNAAISGNWLDDGSRKKLLSEVLTVPQIDLDCKRLAARATSSRGSNAAQTADALVSKLCDMPMGGVDTKPIGDMFTEVAAMYVSLPQVDRHFLAPKILSAAEKFLAANPQSLTTTTKVADGPGRELQPTELLAAAQKFLQPDSHILISTLVLKIAHDASTENWLTQNYELYDLDFIAGHYIGEKQYSMALPLQMTIVQLTDNTGDTQYMSACDHQLLGETYEHLGKKAEAEAEYKIAWNYCQQSPLAQCTIKSHILTSLKRFEVDQDHGLDSANAANTVKSWTSENSPTAWDRSFLDSLEWKERHAGTYTMRLGMIYHRWIAAVQFVNNSDVVLTEYTPPAEYVTFVDPMTGAPCGESIARDANHDGILEVALLHQKLNDLNYHMYSVYALTKDGPKLLWKSGGELGDWLHASQNN